MLLVAASQGALLTIFSVPDCKPREPTKEAESTDTCRTSVPPPKLRWGFDSTSVIVTFVTSATHPVPGKISPTQLAQERLEKRRECISRPVDSIKKLVLRQPVPAHIKHLIVEYRLLVKHIVVSTGMLTMEGNPIEENQ